MTTPLLAWLERPSSVRGVRFSQPDGWRLLPYDELARLVRRTGAALVSAGVRPGDVVTVAQGTGPGFLGALFGVLLIGGVASPVTPPTTFRNPGEYAAHLTRVLEAARPALVVYDAPSVGALAARVGVPAIDARSLLELAGGADRIPASSPSPTALLQFTSGTSGSARAVRIPLAALEQNIAGIQSWLAMTPDDPTASWLPPHHDMGLVGCLLAPVVTGADLWLMSPAEFVRRPLRYLSCFGRHGARLAAMPPFGLDHLVRRVRPEDLTAMDFRDWRAVIVGAERISPACLERFAALCGPYGLRRQALLPAYGLAEATLAVTGLPLAEEWTAHHDGDDAAPVVGCGRPLPGVSVSVVDDSGRQLAAGEAGEIVVGGRCVGDGYAPCVPPDRSTSPPESATSFADGTVRTGDVGFLHEGQLFVLGRRGDSFKIRGIAVHAADLDTVLGTELGLVSGSAVTVLGYDNGSPTVVAVLEQARQDRAEAAAAVLRARVSPARVVALRVPMGTIPRTTSGKPRRRELWEAYRSGALTGSVRR